MSGLARIFRQTSKSGEARHHDVEEQEVGFEFLDDAQGFLTVMGGHDLAIDAAEVRLQEFDVLGVVVGDHDFRRAFRSVQGKFSWLVALPMDCAGGRLRTISEPERAERSRRAERPRKLILADRPFRRNGNPPNYESHRVVRTVNLRVHGHAGMESCDECRLPLRFPVVK